MNKDGGFIKVYRSMLKWEWHDEPLTVATWYYCLLRANWEAERWHGETIQPGQFVTSLSHMAKDIGITKGQLRVALNHLKSTHNIAQVATQHATLITIEKWSDYQSAGEKATQLATQQRTSRQHLDSISTAPIEEYKEYKEREEEREHREKAPVVPEEAHINVDGEVYHYRNGVLQYSPEETRELLSSAHEGWLEAKRRLGML